MGMREWPERSYIVPLAEFRSIIPELDELLSADDESDILGLLAARWREDLPQLWELVYLRAEDTPADTDVMARETF